MESCAPAITEDALLAVRFPWGDELPTPLEAHKGTDQLGYAPATIEEARWSVEHNPLPHVVDLIEVPDVAAALGPVLLFGQEHARAAATDAQLRAGFEASDGRVYRYADHDAWVRVFRKRHPGADQGRPLGQGDGRAGTIGPAQSPTCFGKRRGPLSSWTPSTRSCRARGVNISP